MRNDIPRTRSVARYRALGGEHYPAQPVFRRFSFISLAKSVSWTQDQPKERLVRIRFLLRVIAMPVLLARRPRPTARVVSPSAARRLGLGRAVCWCARLFVGRGGESEVRMSALALACPSPGRLVNVGQF